MQPNPNVIVATDMSEYAYMAEKRAVKLLEKLQTKHLELLNVQDLTIYEVLAELAHSRDEEIQEILKKALKEKARKLEEEHNISCAYSIRKGRVAQEIANHCRETRASVVLVGAHGNNLTNELFIGNVTEKLLHLTRCPVLMVRQPPKGAYQNVLIAVEFNEECIDMVRGALGFVRPAENITLLHAYTIPGEGLMRHAGVEQKTIKNLRENAREKAENEMRSLVALFDRQKDLRRVVKFGTPQEVIADYASFSNPDLIIMSKRASSRAEEMLLGSVSRDVISQTSCDILIIPSRMLEETVVT